MAKRKPAATASDNDEFDLADVWIPLFEAHVLLSIAGEIEGDRRYYERAHALISAALPHLSVALKLVEDERERDVKPTRAGGTK
jgi:hypothetical protein